VLESECNGKGGEIAGEITRTSVRVCLSSLVGNYHTISRAVERDVTLLCVIKADAYGHGAVDVGRALESAGARYFGVATVQEGRELREAGITIPILTLSGLLPWDSLNYLTRYNLVPVISNFDMLARVGRFESAVGLKVHVKVDTGMGRLGFSTAEVPAVLTTLESLSNVEVEGIMSHFPASDQRDDFGKRQIEDFRHVLEVFSDHGVRPKFCHMANSGAICTYPEAHFTMVRPGIMLYGSYPDLSLRNKIALKPVMKWISHVAFVRHLPSDSPVSYGRTYFTTGETTVAYIPVGYADGYPTSLSNRGMVLIRGRGCPVLGRVCMEWTMVDVTDLPDVAPGEEVVLLGDSGKGEVITADDIADTIGSIPYEVLCGISKRVPRCYD
jgi:alanine racemase